MTDTNLIVLGSAATVSAGARVLGVWNQWTLPLLGVPLTVVMVAAFGAFLSNAYHTERLPPKKLYFYAATNTFLASISAAVVPKMMGWDWVTPQLEAPLAGMMAFAAQWWVPTVLDLIPEMLRKLFRLKPKEEEVQNEDINS